MERIVRTVIIMVLGVVITATALMGCGSKTEKKRGEGSKPVIEENDGTKTEKKAKSEKNAEKKNSIGPEHKGELLDIPMGVIEDSESKQLCTVKLPENSLVALSFFTIDGKEGGLNRLNCPTVSQVVDENIIEKECESFPCHINVDFGKNTYCFDIEESERVSTKRYEKLFNDGRIQEYEPLGDDSEYCMAMFKYEDGCGLIIDLNDKWTMKVCTDKNVLEPGMSLKEIGEEILEVITFTD